MLGFRVGFFRVARFRLMLTTRSGRFGDRRRTRLFFDLRLVAAARTGPRRRPTFALAARTSGFLGFFRPAHLGRRRFLSLPFHPGLPFRGGKAAATRQPLFKGGAPAATLLAGKRRTTGRLGVQCGDGDAESGEEITEQGHHGADFAPQFISEKRISPPTVHPVMIRSLRAVEKKFRQGRNGVAAKDAIPRKNRRAAAIWFGVSCVFCRNKKDGHVPGKPRPAPDPQFG